MGLCNKYLYATKFFIRFAIRTKMMPDAQIIIYQGNGLIFIVEVSGSDTTTVRK